MEIPLHFQKHRNRNLNRMFGKGFPVRYTLILEMEKVVLQNGKTIEWLSISWERNMSQDEVLILSKKWIAEDDFLKIRMEGMRSVGEASLTIAQDETL